VSKYKPLRTGMDLIHVLGGDLNPLSGFCFPLISIALPRKMPSAWKTVEGSGSETAANCCKSTYSFWVGYIR
jgi:hypothetical protein